MHEGCTGGGSTGKQMVDKLRMMGFSEGALPFPTEITCECNATFMMETFEAKCPHCGMVYGVTPCSAHDPEAIKPAGIDY